MNRICRQSDAEAIAASFDLMPPRIAERLADVHFLTRIDPVFAGLHRYTSTTDGRPYSETAHMVWLCHQMNMPRARRAPTVVLPGERGIPTVVHELGHALHEQLRFEPTCKPVTWYAETNGYEAFAEAFTAWVLPFGHGYDSAKDLLFAHGRQTVELFESLAA